MKKIMVALIAILLQVMPLLATATLPLSIDPKETAIINGRLYYFSTLTANIPDAMTVCTDANMALVSFETAEEYDAVVNYITANLNARDSYWTSGTRQYDTWIWSSIGRHITYFNWHPSEPDVTDATTQSNMYIYDGLMGDTAPYTDVYRFICEEL